jgi:hypothetical protein
MNNSRTHLNNEAISDEQMEEDEEKGALEKIKKCITCKKPNRKSIQIFLDFYQLWSKCSRL